MRDDEISSSDDHHGDEAVEKAYSELYPIKDHHFAIYRAWCHAITLALSFPNSPSLKIHSNQRSFFYSPPPSYEILSKLCSPFHFLPNPLHPRHFQTYALSLPSQTNAQPRSPTPNAESDCAHGNAMGQSLSAGGVGGLVPLQKN